MIKNQEDKVVAETMAQHILRQELELLRMFGQIRNERQRRSILEIVRAAAFANDDMAA